MEQKEQQKMQREKLGKVLLEIEVYSCKGISKKSDEPYEFFDYRIKTPKMAVSVRCGNFAEGILLSDYVLSLISEQGELEVFL